MRSIPFLFTFWFLALALGAAAITIYNLKAGETGQPPSTFPKHSRIIPESGVPALVMFGHPRCPCTRASLEELATLLGRARARVSTFVVLVQPGSESEDWARKDLWKQALALPGVHVVLDRGGAEARLYDAKTSGQTFLFDSAGRLRFSGGITGSRGHAGENRGSSAVLSVLWGEHPAFKRSPVFGCALFNAAFTPNDKAW